MVRQPVRHIGTQEALVMAKEKARRARATEKERVKVKVKMTARNRFVTICVTRERANLVQIAVSVMTQN